MQDIHFKPINGDYSSYGFIKVAEDKLLFSLLKYDHPKEWKNFVTENFEDFAKAQYYAMYFDYNNPSSRRRKLSNFIKSIFDQKNSDVALIMIKSIAHKCDKLEEEEIVKFVTQVSLPTAGYFKKMINGRYLWDIDDKKRFNKGIGKAFVITYINNKFDKDETWKYIKKHCYLKDDIWCYKSNRNKEIIEKTFLSYFKNGGKILKEVILKEPKKFEGFIKLGKILTEDGEDFLSLEKEIADSKHPVLYGTASTTNIDREDERVSKNFIAKMQRTGKGLPLTDNTHYPQESKQTIGVVKESGGDEENFNIKAKLMKPSDSPAVDFIIKQMKTGINYGLSIGGKITKVFREFSDEMKKEIFVLDDGELFHICLTTQPANADTLGVAIGKALSECEKENPSEKEILTFKHSSKLSKSEPENVDIDKLPDIAFPQEYSTKKVHKDYPHHFVTDKDMLFLHSGLLLKVFAEAISKKAPEYVLNHLATHLQVIGMQGKIDEIKKAVVAVESMDKVKQVTDELTVELKQFFDSIKSVSKLQTETGKDKIIGKIVGDVSTKISDILKPLQNED